MTVLDWPRATVLTCTEFEVSWERLGLGETPWQLEPQRHGMTAPQRQRIVQDVAVDLCRRGLADTRGLRPDLADGLRLLARPDWSVDVRLRHRRMVAAVAACAGDRGVVAVRESEEIALLALPAGAAPDAVLDLLGPIRPAAGSEVHLPAGVLDAAREAAPSDTDRFVDELVTRGTSRSDAATLVAMCIGVDLRGQLGVSAGTGDGHRMRRGRYVVGFHRGSAGYVRQLRGPEPGMVCIGPASRDVLRADLSELVRTVRRPAVAERPAQLGGRPAAVGP